VHHNVIEHLPDQARNPMGRRYMLEGSTALLQLLQEFGVRLVFTGHLHVQDIAQHQSVYEITTGSLVSYPHPYRVLRFRQDTQGHQQLQIESHRVIAIPEQPDLQALSREWMGDRSLPFMIRLLTQPPLNLSDALAEELAPALRYFWADIAGGDATFHFPQLPPLVEQYFKRFGAIDGQGKPNPIDNQFTLQLKPLPILETL
ncbi:MAG TPA: metallophosphoesterase, partial [Coleofasciculaceae cyanobacterium]